MARLVDPAVFELPYYHPDLENMDQVREIMMMHVMQDGAYILRNSFSKPGIFTVTVM